MPALGSALAWRWLTDALMSEGGGDPTINMRWKVEVERGETIILNKYLIFNH